MNQFNSKQQRHGLWYIQNYHGTLIAKGEYMNGFRIGFWYNGSSIKEFFL